MKGDGKPLSQEMLSRGERVSAPSLGDERFRCTERVWPQHQAMAHPSPAKAQTLAELKWRIVRKFGVFIFAVQDEHSQYQHLPVACWQMDHQEVLAEQKLKPSSTSSRWR